MLEGLKLTIIPPGPPIDVPWLTFGQAAEQHWPDNAKVPAIERGRAPLTIMHLQPIAGKPDWKRQRSMWEEMRAAR